MATLAEYVKEQLYRRKKVFIFNDINESLIRQATETILSFPKNTKEIEIWIKSNGGAVEDGFALVDLMMSRKYIVKTIGVGYVSSMAVLILAAGTKGYRYIAPNSSVMVHQIMWGSHGALDEMASRQVQSKMLQEKYVTVLGQVTNKTAKQWDKLLTPAEKWFTAEEVVRLGIADEIKVL